MFLRYNTLAIPPKEPREVKVNLDQVEMISWRFTYTSKRDITHLYMVYFDKNKYRTSVYIPVAQLLDKAALFEHLETKYKDKCLEK